ncbi:MAG: putative tricarboxylic transport rane protein [Clostridia bacterium]|jgi:hypothetical protein|nr:putative tricarboxylic transport rane protein [Clostridia bacterium]MDN5322168.1 putative tricarboxylic transport rane protein [Clostridia bacterium]
MKKADQITGVLLLALSIYIILTGLSLELWWGDEGPGPGFVPFWIGLLLSISSILLIISTFNKKYKVESGTFSKEGLKLLFTLTISAVAAGLMAHVVGMVISMGLLAGFLATFFAEERKIFTTIGILVILPIILYLIFQVALDVPFPKGILGL